VYAFIAGSLVDPGPPTVVDCHGIGYEVWVPDRDRLQLPPVGGAVRLFTHLAVREDDLTLYGFATPRERAVFKVLLGVNGVGPKVALSILGATGSDVLLTAIGRGDVGPLLSVKGVGRKTAERLLLELRDRVQTWARPEDGEPASVATGTREGEAILVLESMGLSPNEAKAAVAAAGEADATLGVEDIVRRALRKTAL
jgi:Holliday junction DNA helicase RuvA